MITQKEFGDFLAGIRLDNKPLPPSLRMDIADKVFPPLAMQAGDSSAMRAEMPLSKFKFGAASESELVGVVPGLVSVARLALTYSEQDFCVYQGGRTIAEQHANMKNGTSQTMDSYHLPQADGLIHALDLVPWIGGKPVWDWQGCYKIAHAMDLAATQLGVANMITWGGAWDRTLADFGGDLGSYEQEMQAYARRHPGKDFVDGPHFQWKR